jgi:hypothetical protein
MECDRVVFNVPLGGIDIEAVNSSTFFTSPQLREIGPGVTLSIPIIVVPERQILRLSYIAWRVFSAQAKQDLVLLGLKKGSEDIIQSGKINPSDPPKRIEEVRPTATTGIPYDKISSASARGFHDNFMPEDISTFSLIFETELLEFVVKNQSDAYSHGIKVEAKGWLMPTTGRSRHDLIESIASIGR